MIKFSRPAARLLGVAVMALSAFNAHATYWNVFNIEGESTVGADLVTYSNRSDMLADANRTGVFTLNGFGRNIVGSDSDGTSYWNVFNIEGESAVGADIVTYGSLMDMLTDANRTGVFTLNGFGRNIVGSGSDVTADTPDPVPEPTSWLLVGLGLAALARPRRRKSPTAAH